MESACTKRLSGPKNLTGHFPTLRLANCASVKSSPSLICAISECRTGSAIFRIRNFPELFAEYARDFACRFPWVQLYTPVNEMYICALFSARYGWWNEQLSSDQRIRDGAQTLVKANVLAMHAILQVRPDAIFIQSEASEYFHAENPAAIKPAEIQNAERFLPWISITAGA